MPFFPVESSYTFICLTCLCHQPMTSYSISMVTMAQFSCELHTLSSISLHNGSGRVVISAVANKDWCPPVPLFMVQHYFTLSRRNCRRAGRRGERSAGRRRHRDCDTQREELHGHVGVQEGGRGSARQKPHSR